MSDQKKQNTDQKNQGKNNTKNKAGAPAGSNKQANDKSTSSTPTPPLTSAKPLTDQPAVVETPIDHSAANTDKKSSNTSTAQQNKSQTNTTGKPNTNSANSASTASKDSKPLTANNKSNGNGSTPPPSKTNTPKQSPLPLIISLIALGLSGYALYQGMGNARTNPQEIASLQDQIKQLQGGLDNKIDNSQLAEITTTIEKIDQDLATKAAKSDIPTNDAAGNGLSDEEVAKLVKQEVDQQVESLLAKQPQQVAQPADALSQEQVNTLIKEALANNAQSSGEQPAIDFSAEIDTIKQNKAEIQQYISDIKQQGEEIKSSLNDSVTKAENTLNESLKQAEQKITAADQRPVVYPLLNSLTLADIAANAHQYGVSNQYLEQAINSFTALNLNQEPYTQFAKKIGDLQQQMQKLADQQNQQKDIDAVINSIDEWPFVATDPENVLDAKADNKPTESWKDDLKRIGSSVLSKTVTITKNDAAGLTWVNENPHLQQIIRENVRLDLAMVRNALLIGDSERANSILSTLRSEIEHYFDTDSAPVQKALSTLNDVSADQGNIPDISALIQSIKQAG